jgi:hypothetical protein
MTELNDIQSGETYRFVINQNGKDYSALIEMDTGMYPMTGKAAGTVQESTYPTGGWEGKHFRIHSDGTVSIPNDPFSPVGEVVKLEKA